MNSKVSILALALTFCILPAVQAKAYDGTRGGGDEIAIEFQSDFFKALKVVESKNVELTKKIDNIDTVSLLGRAHILTVDEGLKITFDGVTQSSVATNDPASGTILVNRSRWEAIKSQTIREGIALHEVLSLGGIERTGQYPISGQYVAYHGLDLIMLISGEVPYHAPLASQQSAGGGPSITDVALSIFQEKESAYCRIFGSGWDEDTLKAGPLCNDFLLKETRLQQSLHSSAFDLIISDLKDTGYEMCRDQGFEYYENSAQSCRSTIDDRIALFQAIKGGNKQILDLLVTDFGEHSKIYCRQVTHSGQYDACTRDANAFVALINVLSSISGL